MLFLKWFNQKPMLLLVLRMIAVNISENIAQTTQIMTLQPNSSPFINDAVF